MKTTTTRELFYREQTIANLRFLLGADVDVLTSQPSCGGCSVVALAYVVGSEGERIQVMQSAGLGVTYALQDLFNLSTKRVGEYFAGYNHQVANDQIATCSIALPREPESSTKFNQSTPQRSDVVREDKPFPEEAEENEGDHVAEPNLMTVRCSESCEAERKGYSVLVHIEYPYQSPIGGLRYIGAPSRQEILQVVSKIMSEHGLSHPVWPMKALCVKHDNTAYDILRYEHDHIGGLLDDILKSKELLRLECIY